MGKRFIPRMKLGNSRSPRLCSKPFAQNCNSTSHLRSCFCLPLHPARNPNLWLERRVTNGHEQNKIGLKITVKRERNFGRVMGAWWPSRSSKPLSVRYTGRGVFDSLPLRHTEGGIKNEECRKEPPRKPKLPGAPDSAFFP